MSDYTPIVDFSAKDALNTGDSNKLILGTELDAELAAMKVAIDTKSEGLAGAVTIAAATFTPTWTGFSSAPSGDVRYQKFTNGTHSFVVLTDDAGAELDGTSDTTAMTITGIPAAITPDILTYSEAFIIRDNDLSTTMGLARIGTDNVITFYKMDSSGNPAAAGFTSSNTKGLAAGSVLFYHLVLTA